MSKVKNYCFTLNNYTEDNIKQLEDFYKTYSIYLIYGKEEGDKTHTPHLQGFIQLKNRMSISSFKKKLGINTIHLEAIKGTVQDNINYCKKDQQYKEYGECLIRGSNTLKKNNIREQIKQCKTWKECLEIEGIEKYLKFAREYYNSIDRRDKTLYQDVKLYEWQEQIIKYMDKPGTSREILFIIDKQGGKGKSFLCAYCQTMRDDTFISDIGKTADILYIYKDNLKKNILLDTQRDLKYDEFNWKLIENITNRFFTSTKYESQIVNKPELTNTIIFTNDIDYRLILKHLSRDRIRIMNLGDDKPTIKSIDDYDDNIAGAF